MCYTCVDSPKDKSDRRNLGMIDENLLSNFSLTSIIIGFVFSGIGFVYFRYGKGINSISFMLSGMALMFFVYIFDTTVSELVVGTLLTASPFIANRLL